MKKKILFTAYTLDVGGIETALVNLLNELIKKCDVTLVLEKKQGKFLNELNENLKVIEYNPNQNKNVFTRKFINLLKRIKFILMYKNKFDFSASFATYSKMGSFCARTASKNNALWVHTDYTNIYKNKKEFINFFKFISYNKFKNLICVSNAAKKGIIEILGRNDVIVIKNLIDYEKILKNSKVKIKYKKNDKEIIFLNVSRHEEESKKLTRIIYASEKLKNEFENFKVFFIGQGKDTNLYKKIVKERHLENNIIFIGERINPYPYYKISNCFLLTSEYEGYPVVFNECMTLNLPIITTDVSDAKEIISNKFGLVIDKDIDSIYIAMKQIIYEGYEIKEKFNVAIYNDMIRNKIYKLIDGGNDA